MTMRNHKLIIGSVLLVFCLLMYFVLIPSQISETSVGTKAMSPALFPEIAVIAIALLSILLVLNGIHDRIKANRQSKQTEPVFSHIPKVSIAFGVILIYVFLMEVIGFAIATPLFLVGFMLFLGERKLYKILAASIITTAVIYILFSRILNTFLPKGIIFG